MPNQQQKHSCFVGINVLFVISVQMLFQCRSAELLHTFIAMDDHKGTGKVLNSIKNEWNDVKVSSKKGCLHVCRTKGRAMLNF